MGPYKCPDCGIWWAGLEHRCAMPPARTTTNLPPSTFTVHCTCPPERWSIPNQVWAGSCPVHDVQVTYTT